MSSQKDFPEKTTEKAIEECRENATYHKEQTKFWFKILISLIILFIISFAVFAYYSNILLNKTDSVIKKYEKLSEKLTEDLNKMNYKYNLKPDSVRKAMHDEFIEGIEKQVNTLLKSGSNCFKTKILENSEFKEFENSKRFSESYKNNYVKEMSPVIFFIDDTVIYFNATVLYSQIKVATEHFFYKDSTIKLFKQVDNEEFSKLIEEQHDFAKNNIYLAYGILISIIGISISIYRYHLKETSKHQHHLLGFQRISISENTQNIDDYAKYYLSKDAFNFNKPSKETIESPVPGHIGSDFGTWIFKQAQKNMQNDVKKNKKDDD